MVYVSREEFDRVPDNFLDKDLDLELDGDPDHFNDLNLTMLGIRK